MPDIYDAARLMAIDMLGLRANGGYSAAAVLVQTATPEYEPGQPPPVPVESRYTGSATRVGYNQRDIDGTVILQNDVRFLVSPIQDTGADLPPPQTGDVLEFAGTAYKVMSVRPWDFVGLQIGFVLQGRE